MQYIKRLVTILLVMALIVSMPLVYAGQPRGSSSDPITGGHDNDTKENDDSIDTAIQESESNDQTETKIVERESPTEENESDTDESLRDRFDEHVQDSYSDAEHVLNRTGSRLRTDVREALEKRFENLREEQQAKLAEIRSERKLERLVNHAGDQIEKIAGLSQDKIAQLSSMSRARIGSLSDRSSEEIQAVLENEPVDALRRIKNNYKVRNVAEERAEDLKKQYQNARGREQKIRSELEGKRRELTQALQSKNETESVLAAKEYVQTYANGLIAYLEKLNATVAANENIDNTTVTNYRSIIDDSLDEVEAIKSKIAAATTKEEVKEYTKTLREISTDIHARGNSIAGSLVTENIGEIIIRARHLEKRAEAAADYLYKQNNLTAGLDTQITRFSETVEQAREQYEQGKEQFEQARSVADSEGIQNARDRIQEAQHTLRDAYSIYQEIWRTLQEKGFQMNDFIFDDESFEYDIANATDTPMDQSIGQDDIVQRGEEK